MSAFAVYKETICFDRLVGFRKIEKLYTTRFWWRVRLSYLWAVWETAVLYTAPFFIVKRIKVRILERST